jgi:hypothetical protein
MARRFTPDELATLMRMAALGHTSVAIGRALGRRPNVIREKCAALGISLMAARVSQSGSVRFRCRASTWDVLRAEAAARGFGSVGHLLRAIVELVVQDKLLDAVIDVAAKPRAPAEAASLRRVMAAGRNPVMQDSVGL